MEFSKKHTQIAKGIAILMMLYHHLYIVPDRIHYKYFSLLDCVKPNTQMVLAVFCKLCVCIYVFLSGFGLFHQLKDKTLLEMYKKVLYRLLKFATLFWLIYLLFVPVGFVTEHFSLSGKNFLVGIFGLNLDEFNNTWWFVNQYIIILAVSPLYINLFNSQKKIIWRLLQVSIIPALYLCGKIFIKIWGSNIVLNNYFWCYENKAIMATLLMGIICARFNVYSKINSVFEKIKNKKAKKIILLLSMSILLVLAMVLRIKTLRYIADLRFDFIVAPIFIFASTTIVCELKLCKMFELFGKHSTIIWLTHAFICYTYFQKILFLPYYSELVFVWFAILSLVTSYLVNLILVPVENLLYSKPHKLSYKGLSKYITP